jgi:phosphoglycerol transferase MdoB-like AlkP superfamily enzyme
MKGALRYFGLLYFFWVGFFQAFRLVFWAYHGDVLGSFGVQDMIQVMRHGIYMDASMSAYFALLPTLLWLVSPWLPEKLSMGLIRFYSIALLWLVLLGLAADLEIFANWGHRLDAAVLPYLVHPREAFASMASSPLWLLALIWLFGLIASGGYLHLKLQRIVFPTRKVWWPVLLALPAFGLWVVLLRGGLQLAPMNQSSVYFSNHRLLNQAAENPIWVFFQSVLEGQNESLESYIQDKPERAKAFVQGLYKPGIPDSLSVLNQVRPNIVLVVWESLSAKVTSHLNGIAPSTPNLDDFARNGMAFTNLYANGDRSDKGLAALLASVPALGKASIMTRPDQTAHLPFLSKALSQNGYSTLFLYGGELEFANMKSFMLNAGFGKILGKSDFPEETYNSKWGAHDEVLFARQLKEAAQEKGPFFHVLFTLSSHEPFEVPGATPPAGLPVDSLFCRSHRYTDKCFGRWLLDARRQDWWSNTLVVIVADHGHTHPGKSGEADPAKFHIPMVWGGPALRPGRNQIETFGNQTDFQATLRAQLGLGNEKVPFSKDLLAQGTSDFAFFSFRNGSVFIQPSGTTSVTDPIPARNAASWYRQAVTEQYFRSVPPKALQP